MVNFLIWSVSCTNAGLLAEPSIVSYNRSGKDGEGKQYNQFQQTKVTQGKQEYFSMTPGQLQVNYYLFDVDCQLFDEENCQI